MNRNNARHVFTLDIDPPWRHMDALGHVNNTRYFEYCEQARIAWIEELGLIRSLSGLSNTGPVVINAACTFLKPVVYPAHLRVLMFAGEPGNSSFETWYEIRGTSETLHCTGSAKTVWVDYRAEKSVPIPPEIRDVISGGSRGTDG